MYRGQALCIMGEPYRPLRDEILSPVYSWKQRLGGQVVKKLRSDSSSGCCLPGLTPV